MFVINILKALEAEMQARAPISNAVCIAGDELIKDRHPRTTDISARINSLQKQWERLKNLVAAKRARLEDAAESAQVKKCFFINYMLQIFQISDILPIRGIFEISNLKRTFLEVGN